MTALFQPGPQSGDRRPAPGRLALVQAFLNSHFDLEGERGADQFADPARLRQWMRSRGLRAGRLTPRDVERAIQAREALRALTAEHIGTMRDPQAARRFERSTRGAAVGFAIDEEGQTFPVPASEGLDGLLGLVLAVVHEAQTGERWYRLKACPGPHCGWVFYDHSRNCSSSWCSMQVCGGRDKARAYRRRSREH